MITTVLHRFASAILSIALALAAPQALAAPVSGLDLQSLVQKSDVIVVAVVDKTDDIGTSTIMLGDAAIDATVVRADLEVISVLKGSVSGNSVNAQYLVPHVPIGYRTLSVGQVKVLFLAVGAGGNYIFANPHFPSLPAVAGATFSESDPLGRVLDEERSVLAAPTSTVPDKEEAVYAIGLSKDPRATNALLPSLNDPSISVRLAAAGELADRNNVQGADVACESLLKPPNGAPAYVLHNLRVGIRDGVKDEHAIPCLTQLLQSGDDNTREAAASALRHTGSPAAISPLAAALDDSDEVVRYQAVSGLAEISGQSRWRPNLIEFHKDGAKFITHWKAWASSQ